MMVDMGLIIIINGYTYLGRNTCKDIGLIILRRVLLLGDASAGQAIL